MTVSDGDYQLGDKVTFTRELRRKTGPWEHGKNARRLWSAERWPGDPGPDARAGIVVGIRTLSDGEVIHHGYEDGTEYRPTRHFKAYLIAFDLRQLPVLVLPEHVQKDEPWPSSRMFAR